MGSSPSTNCDDATMLRHLDWSNKQGRILTAGGRAEEFYTAERGFPFVETQLPHYYLLRKDTNTSFEEWRRARSCHEEENQAVVVGVWTRPLFYGGFEHTTNDHERVFNVQTPTLFIDMRIPKSRECVLGLSSSSSSSPTCLEDLTNDQLRCYARQHIFAGYTRMEHTDDHNQYHLVCTRHHCIDHNFVGVGRTRPNKWCVEQQNKQHGRVGSSSSENISKICWKEWAFATDHHGQHYYCERWESLLSASAATSTGSFPFVALRKATPTNRDGILLVMGDHLQYILARLPPTDDTIASTYGRTTLVSVVDSALENGDRPSALHYLSIQGGHARRSSKEEQWIVGCAIEPWAEGKAVWNIQEDPVLLVQEESTTTVKAQDCHVLWKGERWDIFETNLKTASQLCEALGLS